MTKYIGVKIISAEPMSKIVACNKGLIRKSECNDVNADGYKVTYEDGYESWSPKDVFEKAYRPIDGMTFGLAVEALKKGHRVARKGWNDKNMFLFLSPKEFNRRIEDVTSRWSDYKVDDFIVLATAQKTFQPGWTASQTDILAEDWVIFK